MEKLMTAGREELEKINIQENNENNEKFIDAQIAAPENFDR